MLVVALVAILVIGPKDLPIVMRTLGRYVGKARAVSREFMRNFEDVAQQAEFEEIRRQAERTGGDISKALDRMIDPTGAEPLPRKPAASAEPAPVVAEASAIEAPVVEAPAVNDDLPPPLPDSRPPAP